MNKIMIDHSALQTSFNSVSQLLSTINLEQLYFNYRLKEQQDRFEATLASQVKSLVESMLAAEQAKQVFPAKS